MRGVFDHEGAGLSRQGRCLYCPRVYSAKIVHENHDTRARSTEKAFEMLQINVQSIVDAIKPVRQTEFLDWIEYA
jgi:hypothetical protein